MMRWVGIRGRILYIRLSLFEHENMLTPILSSPTFVCKQKESIISFLERHIFEWMTQVASTMTARSLSCYTALCQAKNVSTTIETHIFSKEKRGAEHVRSTFQDRSPGRE